MAGGSIREKFPNWSHSVRTGKVIPGKTIQLGVPANLPDVTPSTVVNYLTLSFPSKNTMMRP